MDICDDQFVTITVDKYETVRLIDLEGLIQEERASQMNIARTTVQGIYNNARRKLAESLVNGKILRIGGEDYILCSDFERSCDGGRCCRHRCERDIDKNEDKSV